MHYIHSVSLIKKRRIVIFGYTDSSISSHCDDEKDCGKTSKLSDWIVKFMQESLKACFTLKDHENGKNVLKRKGKERSKKPL